MRTVADEFGDASSATLYIPGTLKGKRNVVIYKGKRYFVQSAPFNLLLQAITARFAKPRGYLYRLDIVLSKVEPHVIGMRLNRLRTTIAFDIIETHSGSLLLTVERVDIAVDRAVFDLPPEIVDPRVLKQLREALGIDL